MTGACASFIWLCLAFGVVAVCGDCTLGTSTNPPFIVKSFGSRKLTKKLQDVIRFKAGETIEAFCPTGFERTGDRDVSDEYIKRVQIRCESNSDVSHKSEGNYDFHRTGRYNNPQFICRRGAWQALHESRHALPGCGMNMSYAIGIAPTPSNQIITAAVCYDLDRLALRYVNYVAQPNSREIISNQLNLANIQRVSLDEELSNVDTFFSFISQKTFREWLELNKRMQPLLNTTDFDYTSLIRDAGVNEELKDFDYIFNTIWWRNLRLGNWQLYLNALEERTKSVQYLVSMGTSGVVTLPKISCSSPAVLAVEADGITANAPKYIWAHLRSLNGATNAPTEEFVVIANNSPFNPISNGSTFCADICDEIDWLRTSLFGKVRLLPTMGVVFCCRPEEVAEKLDNFPYQAQQPSATMKPISPPELDGTQTFSKITRNNLITIE